MSAADYNNRTADMLAFRSVTPANTADPAATQQLVVPGDGGALVTGIYKLAQNVLLALLTPLGSKVFLPNDGSRFLLDAQAGLWRTVADVNQSFYAARSEVSLQLQADESSTDPPDEQYYSMSLLTVTLNSGSVALTIILTSRAGNNYTFIAPITVPL